MRFRFGNRLRKLLVKNGRSTDDLATLTKLPVARITKIMEGRYARLTIRDMELIANALNAPLYTLLEPADSSAEASEHDTDAE